MYFSLPFLLHACRWNESITFRHSWHALLGKRTSQKSAYPFFEMRKQSRPLKFPVIVMRIMNKPCRDQFSNEMQVLSSALPDLWTIARRLKLVLKNHTDGASNSIILYLHMAKRGTSKTESVWMANRNKCCSQTLKRSGFSGAWCLFLREGGQFVTLMRVGCGFVLSSNFIVSLWLKPYFQAERIYWLSYLLLFKTFSYILMKKNHLSDKKSRSTWTHAKPGLGYYKGNAASLLST